MEYIYCAMILHKLKKEINEENIKKIINSIGIKPDDARIKAIVEALKDIDIEEAMNKNIAVAASSVQTQAPTDQNQEKQTSAKKEEKPSPEEDKKSEEDAAAGLGALFG
ncbi:MAG: 50S ribosomal protein P1 [Candidatus Aenigmarchaeota archaeon ex4484_52]|nr:MAG: 50S ribosomal protein P1 [Candidatus Aenigmarchaeota archaeon ex4484_52]